MTESASKKKDKPPYTHTAWILRTELMRKGRRIGRWIDEGTARIEPDGDVSWVYLHSLPIGGFDGRICLAKSGIDPNDILQTSQRPARPDSDHEGEEEDSDV